MTDGGDGATFDVDGWRQAALLILDRVDQIAATLIDGGEPLADQVRGLAEVAFDELGDVLARLLGQLIAILQACQSYLESVGGQRDRGASSDSFQTIPVTIHR